MTDFANDHLVYRRAFAVEVDEASGEEKDHWINFDTAEMERLYNLVYKYRDEITDFVSYLGDLKRRGARLADFLTTAYDLK